MPRSRPIAACDAETDPFKHGRVPMPFIWGLYDGTTFETFNDTGEFVRNVQGRELILYAHNGGKFDFMYLLPYLQRTKAQLINGRIVSMFLGDCELRDSYSVVPESLKNIKKRSIDMWKLEASVRKKYHKEIVHYLEGDCVYLWELMDTYRREAGVKKTIASNALAYSKRLGIDPGKTNHRFDCNYRAFYFGGRTECMQPGTHKNIAILDIHSAYPFAMMHDHATGDHLDFHSQDSLEGLSRDEIQRSFLVVDCMSRGAFPVRNGNKGLSFPHTYRCYNPNEKGSGWHVTGWEYLAALDLGLLSNVQVVRCDYSTRKINFKSYVEHWYAHKQKYPKKDNPIQYTIAKIMMNSLYGKLAQNPERYYDYEIVPAGTPVDRENGWQHVLDFEQLELHARPCLWRYGWRPDEISQEEKEDEAWKYKRIYKNVATGASITGFTRAHLLRAMHSIGIENCIYTDTDSIIARAGANLKALSCTDKLGDWEIEDALAPVGHFAGKKLYAIRLSKKDKDGNTLEKIASKGSKLSFDDVKRIVQNECGNTNVKGEYLWKSEAPSFSLVSGRTPWSKNALGEIDTDRLFVQRKIRKTA